MAFGRNSIRAVGDYCRSTALQSVGGCTVRNRRRYPFAVCSVFTEFRGVCRLHFHSAAQLIATAPRASSSPTWFKNSDSFAALLHRAEFVTDYRDGLVLVPL